MLDGDTHLGLATEHAASAAGVEVLLGHGVGGWRQGHVTYFIDQRRTLGPAEAIAAGSDYLVVGRPITEAPDPSLAVRAILSEMSYRIA